MQHHRRVNGGRVRLQRPRRSRAGPTANEFRTAEHDSRPDRHVTVHWQHRRTCFTCVFKQRPVFSRCPALQLDRDLTGRHRRELRRIPLVTRLTASASTTHQGNNVTAAPRLEANLNTIEALGRRTSRSLKFRRQNFSINAGRFDRTKTSLSSLRRSRERSSGVNDGHHERRLQRNGHPSPNKAWKTLPALNGNVLSTAKRRSLHRRNS